MAYILEKSQFYLPSNTHCVFTYHYSLATRHKRHYLVLIALSYIGDRTGLARLLAEINFHAPGN